MLCFQGYRVFLETSLSKKLHDYTSEEVSFSADQPNRAINLKFDSQVSVYSGQ